MLKISFLRTSLRGLRVIPTSPTLRISPHTSLHVRHDVRVEQVALVVSRTYSTTPSSSKLVVSGELNEFPLGVSNFRDIREIPGLAYFDKTGYIPLITRGPPVKLFCRPRRFGKSLTISMLQYFHGVEFRDQYYQLFKVRGYEMPFTYNLY
jgi:Predicted AAA-ATPase